MKKADKEQVKADIKTARRELEKTRVAEIRAIGNAIAALAEIPSPQQCALLIERILGPLNTRLSYMRHDYDIMRPRKNVSGEF